MTTIFQLPDKEKNIRSHSLYLLIFIWTLVTCLISPIEFYFFPHFWAWWLAGIVSTMLIAGVSIAVNRFGYIRPASWLFTVMLWLSFTVPCYSTGGIISPNILSQMSVLLTAGFLLGWSGGLTIGLLTIGVDFGFVYLEMIGRLPPPYMDHTPLMWWMSGMIPFGTVLALQYYALRHLRISLTSLQRQITKGQEVSDSLRASEERYKSIIAVSNTGAWEYHHDTGRMWYSPQYFSMIGLDYPNGKWDETLQDNWIERLHPDDLDRSTKVVEDYLKNEAMDSYENTFRLRHQSGEWLWIWTRGKKLRDNDGNLTGITLGTIIDISERVKAEEKIQETAQLIRKITSQVPGNTYMFEIKESGLIDVHFVNRGVEEFNHNNSFNEISKDPEKFRDDVLHEDDKAMFLNKMKESYQKQSIISFQYRIIVNEKIRWRWIQAIPEKEKSGKIMWYGATSDITPLVEYIVSVEQTLFDISHVIRRPISSILGITSLMRSNVHTQEELKEICEKLYLIAEEMDKFSSELNIAYNKKSESRKFNIDVSSLIDKRISLFT